MLEEKPEVRLTSHLGEDAMLNPNVLRRRTCSQIARAGE